MICDYNENNLQGTSETNVIMRFERRQRTTFSNQQLAALNAAFKKNHYPEPQVREHLAKTTNLDPKRIQVWFQNQRAKDRKRRGPGEDLDSLSVSSPPSRYAHLLAGQTSAPSRPKIDTGSLMGSSSANPQTEPSRLASPQANHNDTQIARLLDCKSSNDTCSAQVVPFSSTPVRVFDSSTANEAAQAVSEGKCESILEYHRNKYGNLKQQNFNRWLLGTPSVQSLFLSHSRSQYLGLE